MILEQVFVQSLCECFPHDDESLSYLNSIWTQTKCTLLVWTQTVVFP